MKFNKLNIAVIFLMTALFAGCSEFDDTVESSPMVADGNAGVIFNSDNGTHFDLEPSGSLDFTLLLTRDSDAAALEVPVTVVTNDGNSFVVPTSVSFAAGANTASITIGMVDGAAKGIELNLAITLDESLTNPYKTGYSSYYGNVTIPDWETFATGTYTSWWTETSFDQILEYSPVLDQYRFASLIADGYHFIFEWDGAAEFTPIPETIETGDINATYGMVSATTNASAYDAATKTLTFTRKWTVAAGSFGEGDDTYVMD